jgi:hypothetical protein
VRRIALLGAAVAALTACSGGHGRTLGGPGITLSLPYGWHGLAAPGQLQAADFPLARNVLASAERVRVRRGHVHVIVWDYGPVVPYLAANNPPTRGPLVLRARDVTPSPLEGFPSGHTYAVRSANLGGELVEVVADLGPKPFAPVRLHETNEVVSTLKVPQPRVLPARNGALEADGLSLRLLPGWTGRVEIPPSKFAARLVLRARNRDTRLMLFELPRSLRAPQRALPVTLKQITSRFARRVFSVRGRNFDISAVFASPAGLEQADPLLAGLRLARR